MSKKTELFIIADVGSNHRGRLDLAIASVKAAKECGADAVKFQMFTHEELYGLPGPSTRGVSFQREWLAEVFATAEGAGLEFMCTAFSPEGVRLVDPFVRRHKVASSELPHWPLIQAIVQTEKPFIVSTGGVSHGDVRWLHDMLWHLNDPSIPQRVSVLECVARYPAPPDLYDVTILRAQDSVERPTVPAKFDWGQEVWHYRCAHGLSDHTIGVAVACAAVGAGATILEKHFDPFPGEGITPDTVVSTGPAEFKFYVQDVREAFSAIHDGLKQSRHQKEAKEQWLRRYVATQPIAQDEALLYGKNFGIFRSLKPDTRGYSPITMPVWRISAMHATVALQPGDTLGPGEIK